MDQSLPTFSLNVGGVVLFRFSSYRSVPEIFGINVESCRNRAKFWMVEITGCSLGVDPWLTYDEIIFNVFQPIVITIPQRHGLVRYDTLGLTWTEKLTVVSLI